MEKDQVMILEQSDISRLLTLFEHWKSCGDFRKLAPLALQVGARLEEWDLPAQSLELYEDALEMAFDGVEAAEDQSGSDEEWVQVKAKSIVLDLILRLHICIGLCHQRLGDDQTSVLFFEDAYNILQTASKLSKVCRMLRIPILASLCVMKLEEDEQDPGKKVELERLVETFVREAEKDGNMVHIGRALSMKAVYKFRMGKIQEALKVTAKLGSAYDVEKYCEAMITEYGRDYAMECHSESIQWLYLVGNHDAAEEKADTVVHRYLGLLDPSDTDYMMHLVLPIIQVFSLLDRAKDADQLLKEYVISPFHEFQAASDFWIPLFNPLAYLLEIIMMEDEDDCDSEVLADIEGWVLDEENSDYDEELERKAHTIMGEICWRLAHLKEEDDDPARKVLLEKARDLLTPVARYAHSETFLRRTAQALLEAL
jgi:tetratricopeptide (TPR) repeat protein